MEYREFNVGDIVRVVETPYHDCPYSWVSSMNAYCSREAEVTGKEYTEEYGTYAYRIDVDRGSHVWCGNCFEPLGADLEIEAASDDELLEFLM